MFRLIQSVISIYVHTIASLGQSLAIMWWPSCGLKLDSSVQWLDNGRFRLPLQYIYLYKNRTLSCLRYLQCQNLGEQSLRSVSVRSMFVPVIKIHLVFDYVAFDSDIRYHRDNSFVIQSLERRTNLDSHHRSDHVRILKLTEHLTQTLLEPRYLKQSSEILHPDNRHYTFWTQRSPSWVQQAGCGLNLWWAALWYVYMTSICGQFRHELLSSADSRAETRKNPETGKSLKLFHVSP